MKTESADELLARIAALASARPGGIVATDGDGTLWSGDIGEDSFFEFLAAGDVAQDAAVALRDQAGEFGLDVNGAPVQIARRIFDAYTEGRFPEERVCEVMTWCFAGWTRAKMRAFAADVVAKRALSTRLHRELGRVLEGVRRAGIEVYLVSASPRAVVEAAANIVGIDAAHVVAATPRYANEPAGAPPDRAPNAILLADVERPIPYGAGKVAGLRARVGDRELYAAFGDNLFDIPMLAHASIPVAVRPKPRLRDRADEVPALVLLAEE